MRGPLCLGRSSYTSPQAWLLLALWLGSHLLAWPSLSSPPMALMSAGHRPPWGTYLGTVHSLVASSGGTKDRHWRTVGARFALLNEPTGAMWLASAHAPPTRPQPRPSPVSRRRSQDFWGSGMCCVLCLADPQLSGLRTAVSTSGTQQPLLGSQGSCHLTTVVSAQWVPLSL